MVISPMNYHGSMNTLPKKFTFLFIGVLVFVFGIWPENFARAQYSEIFKAPLKITKTLYMGMFDEEVGIVQSFFKQFPVIYPEGLVTKYFGRLTQRAVRKFQSYEGIESVGIVGPKTRAKINQYLLAAPSAAGLSHRSEQVQPATPATPAIPAVPSPGQGTPAQPAQPAKPATPDHK